MISLSIAAAVLLLCITNPWPSPVVHCSSSFPTSSSPCGCQPAPRWTISAAISGTSARGVCYIQRHIGIRRLVVTGSSSKTDSFSSNPVTSSFLFAALPISTSTASHLRGNPLLLLCCVWPIWGDAPRKEVVHPLGSWLQLHGEILCEISKYTCLLHDIIW